MDTFQTPDTNRQSQHTMQNPQNADQRSQNMKKTVQDGTQKSPNAKANTRKYKLSDRKMGNKTSQNANQKSQNAKHLTARYKWRIRKYETAYHKRRIENGKMRKGPL
jgi:hypothetical protein